MIAPPVAARGSGVAAGITGRIGPDHERSGSSRTRTTRGWPQVAVIAHKNTPTASSASVHSPTLSGHDHLGPSDEIVEAASLVAEDHQGVDKRQH